MSFALKYILGVFVLLCCVQFIEMSRVRRDEAVQDVTNDLQNAVNNVVAKLKSAMNEDTVKKLMDAAAQTIQEGTKFAQEQLTKISNNAAKADGA